MARQTRAAQKQAGAGYKARKHATPKSRHARHGVKVSTCPLCNPGARTAQREDASEQSEGQS